MSARSTNSESFLPPLWILTLLSIGAALWLAIALKELLVLLVLGYFIAYAIDPLLERLERRRISRPVGVFVIFGVILTVIVLLALTAIPTVVDEFGRLSENLNHYVDIGKGKLEPYIDKARRILPQAEQGDLSTMVSSLPSIAHYVSGDTVKGVLKAALRTLLQGYNLTLTFVNVALLPFIVFYLATDLTKIHHFLLALVPHPSRRKVAGMFGEIDVYVSSFVRGQVTVCAVLFVLYAIGLGFVGVDLWLLLAAISGFGNLIPYAGFLTGIVLSTLMALVTFGDISHVLWVWAVYAVVQFLEGTFVTPKILGESVGLSPLVIILALFAGGQLFGLLGVFLAVPSAAALRVLARHTYDWVVARA